LEVRRIESIKNGNDIVGSRTKGKVVKNKVAPPFKEGEFDIIYGEGISKAGCILDMATELNIVAKSGAWYSYGETRIGQGRDNARDFIKANQEMMAEIEAKVCVAVGLVRNIGSVSEEKETPASGKARGNA
jgi:recombination protein RecA